MWAHSKKEPIAIGQKAIPPLVGLRRFAGHGCPLGHHSLFGWILGRSLAGLARTMQDDVLDQVSDLEGFTGYLRKSTDVICVTG